MISEESGKAGIVSFYVGLRVLYYSADLILIRPGIKPMGPVIDLPD